MRAAAVREKKKSQRNEKRENPLESKLLKERDSNENGNNLGKKFC